MRQDLTVHQERAILIGVQTQRRSEDNLSELKRLAETAGAHVDYMVLQKRSRPDIRSYVGRGKVEELIQLVDRFCTDVVIADDDLTPNQVRFLEKKLNTKVVDRSELILDIFATHARSRQAKIQVELAQLQYASSRLKRLWTHLERQEGVSGGGIATRGPGEKQLEVDRRLIARRIRDLQKDLKTVEKQAMTSRKSRQGLFRVSLVGYTNAGKSTLMEALTGEDVIVEDKLFSTLDALTRRLDFKWPPVLLSDTVGFIRKLPKHLLSSFRTTLNEVIESDLILEVVDSSDPYLHEHRKVVSQVLESIRANHIPRLTVYNKIDCLSEEDRKILKEEISLMSGMCVSALSGDGLQALQEKLHEKARREACPVWIEVPASNGALVADLKKWNGNQEASWRGETLHFKLFLPESEILKYKEVREIRLEKLIPKR